MNEFVIEFLFSQFYTKYKLITYFTKKITCIVRYYWLSLFCVLMAIGVLFWVKKIGCKYWNETFDQWPNKKLYFYFYAQIEFKSWKDTNISKYMQKKIVHLIINLSRHTFANIFASPFHGCKYVMYLSATAV